MAYKQTKIFVVMAALLMSIGQVYSVETQSFINDVSEKYLGESDLISQNGGTCSPSSCKPQCQPAPEKKMCSL